MTGPNCSQTHGKKRYASVCCRSWRSLRRTVVAFDSSFPTAFECRACDATLTRFLHTTALAYTCSTLACSNCQSRRGSLATSSRHLLVSSRASPLSLMTEWLRLWRRESDKLHKSLKLLLLLLLILKHANHTNCRFVETCGKCAIMNTIIG